MRPPDLSRSRMKPTRLKMTEGEREKYQLALAQVIHDRGLATRTPTEGEMTEVRAIAWEKVLKWGLASSEVPNG